MSKLTMKELQKRIENLEGQMKNTAQQCANCKKVIKSGSLCDRCANSDN